MRKRKTKRVPLRDRLRDAFDNGHRHGYKAATADVESRLKTQTEAAANVAKRLELVEQICRAFGQTCDAFAHAVQFAVGE